MATRPRIATLTNSSVDILNAIRNNASVNYKEYVPVATADADVIRTIGAVLVDSPQLQNEFITALINRIGKVIVTSKLYDNPWAVFKKGILDYGETIEEIFVDIAEPFNYDPETAETNVFKRQIPNVRSAFHVVNYEKFYKDTIQRRELEKAFLSINSVGDFISKIIDSMYTGANYDEYQTMKYLLAKRIYDGLLYPEQISAVTDANMKSIASTLKGVSNNLEFLSSKYNIMGVHNKADKREQYLIVNTAFDAKMDVEVLASAFNMDKAEFLGHRILVDGFGNLDYERLHVLFDGDNTYTEFTTDEEEALNAVPAVLVDAEFFQVYDKLNEFGELYNPEGLYWNYWYHTWRIFSVSPFSNGIMFIPATPHVTSVTVTPSAVTLGKGQSTSLSVVVATENFAPQGVKWTSTNAKVKVNQAGVVTADSDATGTATIRAISVFDSDKSATCTVTIG